MNPQDCFYIHPFGEDPRSVSVQNIRSSCCSLRGSRSRRSGSNLPKHMLSHQSINNLMRFQVGHTPAPARLRLRHGRAAHTSQTTPHGGTQRPRERPDLHRRYRFRPAQTPSTLAPTRRITAPASSLPVTPQPDHAPGTGRLGRGEPRPTCTNTARHGMVR